MIKLLKIVFKFTKRQNLINNKNNNKLQFNYTFFKNVIINFVLIANFMKKSLTKKQNKIDNIF